MTAKSVKNQVEISLKKQPGVSPAEQLNVANAAPLDVALPVKARRLKKKLASESVGDDVELGSQVNVDLADDSVLADVDVSVLKDGGEWVLAQLGSGVVGGLIDGAGAVAGAGAGAAAGAGAGTAAAAGAAAAVGAGAAGVAAAGVGLGAGAVAAGAGGLALAAGGGGSSAAPAPVDTVAPTGTTGSILHDATNDTGALATDNITANTRPVITGNAEAGARVSVLVGGQTLTTTADASGHYSVTPATALSSGSYTPVITVTDAAGNSSTVNGDSFTVGVALSAPTIVLLSSGDLVNATENTAGVTISGTAAVGSTVKIYDGASLIGTTTADDSGLYSLTGVNFATSANATHNLTATATNNVGTSLASSIKTLVVDTVAPVAATGAILHNVGNDTGSSALDNITANTTPVITGAAETGATVTVLVGGQTLTTTAVSGQYSVTPATALSVGSYTPSITVTDAAGNSSTTAGTAFTVGVALNAPTISLVSGDDKVNDSENTAGVTISGTAAVGSIVSIFDGVTLLGTATANASGNYSLTSVQFAATSGATHNLTATATNNVGPSAASSIHAVTVDTTAPTGLTGAIKHDVVNDTGASNSDSFTANTTPVITGAAETGATVTVLVGGQTLTTTAVSGQYSVTPTTALSLGNYTPSITVVDAAGNSTTTSGTPFTVGVSLGAPTIALVAGDDRVNAAENTAGVTISGAAFADSTVSIYDGANLIGTTTADGAGAYSLTGVHFATSAGATHNLTAIASSNVGPSVASSIHAVAVDTVAPAGVTGAIQHTSLNDTGALASDSITANTTPVITGSAERYSVVTVVVGGQTLTTVAGLSGYAVTPTTALSVGTYTPTITVTDAAGNTTTTNGTPFTVGVALSAPTIALVSGNDLVNGAENTAGVTISGTAAADSTVNIYDGASLIGTTTANGSGSYSLTGVNFATSEGATHNLTATATNNVGPSLASSIHAVTVDTVAPTATTGIVQQDAGNDTGASTGDSITSNTMPIITGHAEAGAQVSVVVAGQTLTTVADINGDYAVIPLAELSDGNHTVTITVTDAAGNSQTVTGATITVDTLAPASATGAITHASDTAGISNTDNITSINTPEITGTAEAGATVTVTVGGQTLTTVADETGHYSVTPEALGEGVQTIVITVTDVAGNSTTSNGTSFEVALPPADTFIALLATNNTDAHPAAMITGHADIREDRGERLAIEFDGVVYEEGVNLSGVILTVENNGDWTLDVSELVKGWPDGHYDVTAIATDVAGNVTTTVVTDALWLVNECQQYVGGNVATDNHWDVTAAQSLAVDFGAYVTVLGGVEVTDFVNSSFTFGADDVTINECGIEVSHGDATFSIANNITFDGVNIVAHDSQGLDQTADDSLFLATGVTLSADGSITMLAQSVDGGVNPARPAIHSEGGLITLTQSHIIANAWYDDAGELVAENSGIHLSAGNGILITADGHVTAGVTLTQSYLGGDIVALGEDVNVRVSGAHIDLMAAGSGIVLVDQYTDIESSGTYTLANDIHTTYPTYESTISGFEGLDVGLYQDHLYARDLIDASDASIYISGTGTIDFSNPIPVGEGVIAGNVMLVQESIYGGGVNLENVSIDIFGDVVSLVDSVVTSHSYETVNGFDQSHDSTYWNAADVGILQTNITADNGVVDASNASISLGGMGVLVGDVGIEQSYISATEGIDLSGANVGVWSQFRVEIGTVSVAYEETATSSSNYSDHFSASDTELQSSDIYVVQQELTAQHGDINASDVHVSQWSIGQISPFSLVNNVYVEQSDITALDGNVTLSNVTASEFNVFTSLGMGGTVDAEMGNFAFASFIDSTFYSQEFNGTNSDVYSETITSSSEYGAEVYVTQRNIYATDGGIDAHDVSALKVQIYGETYYDGTSDFSNPVFSGDVFVEQNELHAMGVDAQGININNARAGVFSNDVLAMVSHTAYDHTFAQDITTATLLGLDSTTIENDYTYYFEETDFASVYVSQTDITADNGPISGINASVDISAESVIAANIYIDQVNITAYSGDVNLSGANLTIHAYNSISLVDHYRTEYERDYYSTFINTTTLDGIYGHEPLTNTFDTALASVGIFQVALSAGGDLNLSDAHVNVSAGSMISLHEAYIVQMADTADGSIIANNAGLTLAGGYNAIIDVENDAYVLQAGLRANDQIDVANAHVTVSAGYSSYVSADNIYVQQTGVTAGGNIDMSGARALVSSGDDGDVYVPGAVYVEQHGVSAGGYIDATGAQVGITVGSDDVNNARIYTDGAYVSQEYLTADSWMDIDGAGVNVVGGNGADIEIDGSAYVSQTENYAGYNSEIYGANAHVTVAAGVDSVITANDVFIEQNHMTAGYLDISAASVEVSVGNTAEISLYGSAYVEQNWISATNGDISASDSNVTLAAGNNSYISADNVYVSQTEITAYSNIDLWGARAVVSAGNGGNVDVPGAVFVEQNNISAGGYIDATGAQVGITVGSDDDYSASIYTDGAYVTQDHLTADSWMDIDNAGVHVVGGDGADIEIDGSAYVSQNDNYAGSNSEIYGANAHVTVAAGAGSVITAYDVFIEQNHMTAGYVDISAASVEVRVGNDAEISLYGSAYIEQNWISAVNGDISASGAHVTVAAGDNSYISADDVYVSQTEMTAYNDIDLWGARAVVTAGNGGNVDVPGAVFVEQNNISAGGYIDATGAQVDITVGSVDTNAASIYTDGAYVSQDYLTAGSWMDIDNAGVNVEGGDGAYVEIDGSAYVSQQYIYANDGIDGSDAHVTLAAGVNGVITVNEAYIAQNNITGAWVDVSAASVDVNVANGGDITLEYGAYIEQHNIRALNGSVEGDGASVRITGGTDSVITMDSSLVQTTYHPTLASLYIPGNPGFVDIPGNGWGYNTVWHDTNTRFDGANVFIDQTQITATEGVNLAGASVLIGVDPITPNIPSLPSNLTINLEGVSVSIEQSNITAVNTNVDLSSAHIDLQAGHNSQLNITPETTQDGTDHYYSRSDWTDFGNNDWNYNYVTHDTVWNTHAEFNDVGISQYFVTADENLTANDVVVRIAAGDDSEITLDATSVRIYQNSMDAVNGAIEVTGATVIIEIGQNSQFNMTPERDGFSGYDEYRTFHEYIDVGHWHDYVYQYNSFETFQENSYGDVAVIQSEMFAASSLNVEGANIQILESSNSDIHAKGISIDINQSNLVAGGGNLYAGDAVVNIHAGDFSGITLVAATEYNHTLTADYYRHNWSEGNYAVGNGTLTSILSDQEFSLRVEQDHLTATNGNVSATAAEVNIVVGSDSEIYLHGADVFVEQNTLLANGGNVDVSNSAIEISGGTNSSIQIEQGTSIVSEQHESGWFQAWSNPSVVFTSTYAGDVTIDQSNIGAYESLSGTAYEITSGGDVYMNDVAITLSVGDATNPDVGWVSAHNVNVTQTEVGADENIYATHVGVSIQAGENAFVEIRNANVIQNNMHAGNVLTSKLVGDYFVGDLTDDNENTDLPIAYWGSMDLSGAYVHLASSTTATFDNGESSYEYQVAASDVYAHEAIIAQDHLWAGTTIDLSSATVDVMGHDVFVSQVVIAQSDITAGGVVYYYDTTGIENASHYQLDQLETLTVLDPLLYVPTTIIGLVDLADASIDISASGNYTGDVIAMERNSIESGLLIDMHSNHIDVTAADMTVGDIHNWLGVDGYYSDGNYDNEVDGVKAATFDFTGNEINLNALSGDIAVNDYVEVFRFVTASDVDASVNHVALTASGNINVGQSVGIGTDVVAAVYDVPVFVNSSNNRIDIVAGGSVNVGDVYIGVYTDNNTTLDLTMDNNVIYISADNVYGNEIYNVEVDAQLTNGSSVNNNSLEVTADTGNGNIGFDGVHLAGTDASAHLWGNEISVGNMTVENMDESHITIGAQDLTLFAGSSLTIDLIDLTSQNVDGYSLPTKDHWWQSDATIGSDYSLNINNLKVDGSQAFLTFEVMTSHPVIHYDISVERLGIAQNNGDLAYLGHSGSAMSEFAYDTMTHDSSEQFDLIDLSDLGITSVDQLSWSVTLGTGFGAGLVSNIHFSLNTNASSVLGAGSTVEFDLQNVKLESSARHDFSTETGQGAVGQVDATDVWYAFWNYSLHLNAALT